MALEAEIAELRTQNEALNVNMEKLGQIIAAFMHTAGADQGQGIVIPGEVMQSIMTRGATKLRLGAGPDPGSVLISATWENRVIMPSNLVVRG